MNLVFSPQAWQDYRHWQLTDRAMLKRLHLLIENIVRHPFEGIGKPEALRHRLAGYWSRRTNEEHRLVYSVDDSNVFFLQLRYHYS